MITQGWGNPRAEGILTLDFFMPYFLFLTYFLNINKFLSFLFLNKSMTTNAGPEYFLAEKKYLNAYTTEEKIGYLEEMIRYAPKHKSSENMLAELRRRLAKLKKELKKEQQTKKKSGKSVGVKKEGNAQVCILGFANSGKSTLLSKLTNAHPRISEFPFTTTRPEIGILDLEGCKVQLVDLPSLTGDEKDKEWLSIARIADLSIILIRGFDELIRLSNYLKENMISGKKIFVLNKIDSLSNKELEKFDNLKNIVKISAEKSHGLDELKNEIFDDLDLIRVYTKEPGKKPTEQPIILSKGSTVKKMAEKIRKDYPDRLISAKVWGKSAKFPGQNAGLNHILQDKDIVELHLK